MNNERTLAIIKPDATKRNLIGKILNRLEDNHFKIIGLKMLQLNKSQAEGFYSEHYGKPFFDGLINFMISGPIVVAVIEKENAIKDYRTLMGATNPEERQIGTLRAEFALSQRENSLHGSDSLESAKREINYFFAIDELITA